MRTGVASLTRGAIHPLTPGTGPGTTGPVPTGNGPSSARDSALIRQQVQRLVAESVFRRWPLSAASPGATVIDLDAVEDEGTPADPAQDVA